MPAAHKMSLEVFLRIKQMTTEFRSENQPTFPIVYILDFLFSFIFSIFNLGKDDDLYTTSTVIIMKRLQVGDRIYIKMDIDGDHGDSKIHSQERTPSIQFVGQKISD